MDKLEYFAAFGQPARCAGLPARYVFNVFDKCPPLPARYERGEGRGGGSPNITRRCSLLSPALSSLRYLFSVVELVALRRVAPRPAAQRLPAHLAVRASRSAAARGGVVAARQQLPLNRYSLRRGAGEENSATPKVYPALRQNRVRLLAPDRLGLDWVSFSFWSASCRPERAGRLLHSSGGNRYEPLALTVLGQYGLKRPRFQ